jgi:acyl-CoA dehydrogenase
LNVDFSDEQKELQKVAREFLAERAPLERVRKALDKSAPDDRDLWKSVAEMGWLGAALPEQYGGGGFGALELAVIGEELGRALAPIPFSSSVCLASEVILQAGSEEQKRRYLVALANGTRTATFALAEPGRGTALTDLESRFDGSRLRGRKSPVSDGAMADQLVVVARGPAGDACLVVVDMEAPGVKRQALHSVDGSRPSCMVEFDDAPAELLAATDGAESIVARLLDRAAVLMAFEQLGGAQACLEAACDYAKNRFAFGRPIGSFQAPKHRLADMFTAVELARSNCYYGAWALSTGSDELPIAACIARISATEAFAFCAEENLHLHGGAGCTWETNCHLYVRRAKQLSQAIGALGIWKERLIERIVSRGRHTPDWA